MTCATLVTSGDERKEEPRWKLPLFRIVVAPISSKSPKRHSKNSVLFTEIALVLPPRSV